MSQSKTDQIIDILVEKTSHTKEEIKTMIKETIVEMDHMINEEGAAYVVANNLNVMITMDQQVEALTIDMLSPGQSNVTIIGRVSRIYSSREFTRKDDTKGKVRNIHIIDETGEVRVALWDKRVEDIEEKNIETGTLIRISGANVRQGWQDKLELSVGSQGSVDVHNDKTKEQEIPDVQGAQLITIGKLDTIEDREDVTVKGKVVDKRSTPSVFERDDGSEGKVTSMTINDGTGRTRVTFWDKHVDKVAELDIGDTIKLTDVNVGTSEYQGNERKELTYRAYSGITSISDPELESIEISVSSGDQTTTELANLSKVEDQMRGITVTGQIISKGSVNTFEREGETHHVGNMTIRDHTQQRRVTLWRDQAKKLDDYTIGDVIRIENASARFNDFSNEVELSVNDYSTIVDVTSEVNVEEFEQEPEFVRLSDITETRRGVSLKAQINRVFDVNTIDRDDGSQAQVLNIAIYDSEGNEGRIAAWDESIAKVDQYNDGDAIILYNVTVKPSDGDYPPTVNVNEYTKIEETELDDIMPAFQSASQYDSNPLNYQKTDLSNTRIDTKVEVKGTIVSAYPPNFYNSCSQCNRKVDMNDDVDETGICPTHGEVEPRTKMIMTMVLDDNYDTIKVKLFDRVAEKILDMTAADAKEMIERLSDEKAPIEKQSLEMKEVIVKGKVIMDDYSEEKQINVESIEEVDHIKESDDFLNSTTI